MSEKDCPCFVKKDRVLNEKFYLVFCAYTGEEGCQYRGEKHSSGNFICRYVEMNLEKTLEGISLGD